MAARGTGTAQPDVADRLPQRHRDTGEPQAQSRRLIMEAALARLGYVEGNNLAIDRRLLSERVEQVNKAAAELVGLRPDAIVAVNTPDVAAAQQPERKRRIGELMAHAENDVEFHDYLSAFREGLQKLGWVEGRRG